MTADPVRATLAAALLDGPFSSTGLDAIRFGAAFASANPFPAGKWHEAFGALAATETAIATLSGTGRGLGGSAATGASGASGVAGFANAVHLLGTTAWIQDRLPPPALLPEEQYEDPVTALASGLVSCRAGRYRAALAAFATAAGLARLSPPHALCWAFSLHATGGDAGDVAGLVDSALLGISPDGTCAAGQAVWSLFHVAFQQDSGFCVLLAERLVAVGRSATESVWFGNVIHVAAAALASHSLAQASRERLQAALLRAMEATTASAPIEPGWWLAALRLRAACFGGPEQDKGADRFACLSERDAVRAAHALDGAIDPLIREAVLPAWRAPDPDSIAEAEARQPPHQSRWHVRTVAAPIDLTALPSVHSLALGEPTLSQPTPIPGVDARPLSPLAEQAPTWCAVIRGATVLGGLRRGSAYWYVETPEGALIADGLNIHPRYHFGALDSGLEALGPDDTLLRLERHPVVKLDGRAILLGGVPNYFHWLMEYLPKLATLAALRPDIHVASARFIVPANLQQWQLDTLVDAGIDLSRLIQVPPQSTVHCTELVVPSLADPRDAVRFLRTTFGGRTAEVGGNCGPTGAGSRVYVSRLDSLSSRRRILDEEGLVLRLMDRGFEVLIPSGVPFQEQVDMMSRAEVIVGAHGAGLANLVFCPPGAAVVELCNSTNAAYRFYEQLAAEAGLRHHRLIGREAGLASTGENAAASFDADSILELAESVTLGDRQ